MATLAQSLVTRAAGFARTSAFARSFQIDAVVCGIAGIALLADAAPLAALTGLPALALMLTGGFLLPYALWLGYVGTRPTLSRRIGWGVAIFNALWTLDSILLLAIGVPSLTDLGWWLILAQGLIVGALADWQLYMLYKSR